MAHRKSPVQTISFLEIPDEIRAQIYNRILRPDCSLVKRDHCDQQHDHPKRFLGCTKILLLNKQIYREAVEHLHQTEIPIRVQLSGLPIFRHPKAFGKPGLFSCLEHSTGCLPSPRFSELQLLSFRKTCLVIEYPGPYVSTASIGCKLQDIAKAVRESQFRSLRIQFLNQGVQTDDTVDEDEDLDQTADATNCEVTVERHPDRFLFGESQDDEPLIPWLLHAIFLDGIIIERSQDPETNDSKRRPMRRIMAVVWRTKKNQSSSTACSPKISNVGMIPILVLTVLFPSVACYALFASSIDLSMHLTANPSCNRRFRYKRRNELAKGVRRGGRRKRRTCALDCWWFINWEHHNDETGHFREDMIPMWAEDNDWWDDLCYDAKLFKAYGMIGGKVA